MLRAPDHHDGKHFQPDEHESHAALATDVHRCPPGRRPHEHAPGDGEVSLDVDADRHGRTVVVGDRAQRSPVRLHRKTAVSVATASAATTPAISLSADTNRPPARACAAESEAGWRSDPAKDHAAVSAHQRAEAERHHQQRDDGSADEPAQHHAVERGAKAIMPAPAAASAAGRRAPGR